MQPRPEPAAARPDVQGRPDPRERAQGVLHRHKERAKDINRRRYRGNHGARDGRQGGGAEGGRQPGGALRSGSAPQPA